MMVTTFVRVAILVLLVVASVPAKAGANSDASSVAVLGFQLINTSLEPTSPDEVQRLAMLDDQFRELLEASELFMTVDIPPDVQEAIATGPAMHACNGCERKYAARAGADIAAWGTVQKVSNLILNVNVYMTDAQSGARIFARSADIRGNTDESWTRGLRYIVRNYLLKQH